MPLTLLFSSCDVKSEMTKSTISHLVFGGDVMFSRFVGRQMKIDNDYGSYLENVAELFKNADMAFVNLESPLHEVPLFQKDGAMFRADAKSLQSLTNAGIDVVSLANNHFGDGSRTGMKYTMEKVQESGLKYVGAGKDLGDAFEPYYFTSHGTRFALFAFCDVTPSYAAEENKVGYAPLPDKYVLENDLFPEAKQHADVIIVSLHTGEEFVPHPSEKKKDKFHMLTDAGASLVVGHHPHVIQDVEEYNGGLIYYSLGNLVFDQAEENTKKGMVAEVEFDGGKISSHTEHIVNIDDHFKPKL